MRTLQCIFPGKQTGKVKGLFVVFCCTTTGVVDCRIMENYNTDSFVFTFVRFSCHFGYIRKCWIMTVTAKTCKRLSEYDFLFGCTDILGVRNFFLMSEWGCGFVTCVCLCSCYMCVSVFMLHTYACVHVAIRFRGSSTFMN